MLTGNKGEWSETYALFKLLGDTKLYSGDANLNRVETIFYPIIKILREQTCGDVGYEIQGGEIVVKTNGAPDLVMQVEMFARQAAILFDKIKTTSGSSFSIPEVEQFMTAVHCNSIAHKSSSKSDIRIVIHDTRINQATELGFSIKSQLGGDSTLFNANKRKTNFVYRVDGVAFDQQEIARINGIDPKVGKIKKRIEEITQLGGQLNFHSIEGCVLHNNLTLIDSLLPQILGEMIKNYFSSEHSSTQALTRLIHDRNPLEFDMRNGHAFYEYKVKHFLTDSALGMTGSKVWNGMYDVTGGYLIVRDNGDVLCYHIYNRNQFEDYLFSNTKLDTPSSTRHEFGSLYEADGQLYFALNLQVRFT